jgi:hypothetical protein
VAAGYNPGGPRSDEPSRRRAVRGEGMREG